MRKIYFIFTLVLTTGFVSHAQQNDDKIRDKMTEFIQKRMKLSRDEAERFTPVFVRYFSEWRQTLRENKDDVLFRQQKIAELRIRYRGEFRDIVGEKRSTDIFRQQEVFIDQLQKMREEQLKTRMDERTNKRFRSFKE
jgi:hypothetical protein